MVGGTHAEGEHETLNMFFKQTVVFVVGNVQSTQLRAYYACSSNHEDAALISGAVRCTSCLLLALCQRFWKERTHIGLATFVTPLFAVSSVFSVLQTRDAFPIILSVHMG